MRWRRSARIAFIVTNESVENCVEAEISVYDSLSLGEKEALLAVLDTLIGDDEGDSSGHSPTHH